MSKLEWSDSYSVGVPRLDAQHKVLIRIINQLEEERRTGGLIVAVFAELRRYVKEHFRDEEVMLEAAGYADLEEHKVGHRQFEEWLTSIEMVYNSGGASAYYIAESVHEFLKDWLITHILAKDMAYKETLTATVAR
ncbi:MAG: bacteriohemerythrin [Sedimenticola sp.]|jgi:hemerythrin|uniref:Bacteriohemerythrin n=1 Tax=Sedimenticola thiotaurini TaxID=1543721 RepID=A0A558CYE9_9GAMM|nr:bacteriohemerythrin [Sedimenticola sp.]TVT53796.1 MAG: bacteriohemerythrin [Sedimenticola thiotaurini]MCW8881113.1 bacteriohemerythrin [Sedimenticola sp.]MCW8946437.1 bacteriohemerythrin [Sedimenticola sp.]MCW8949484.1 bacteriohemerythrin [Sedimenticola sp.]